MAALSLATDLANGYPAEKTVRTCMLALHLGRAMTLPDGELADVVQLALLRSIGCTASAEEEGNAEGRGDDIRFKQIYAPVDAGRVTKLIAAAAESSGSRWQRAGFVARAVLSGRAILGTIARGQCDVAFQFARRLRLPERVGTALAQIYERWDGSGAPHGLAGEALSRAGQVVEVAHLFEILERQLGFELALESLKGRRGTQLSPRVVNVFTRNAREIRETCNQAPVFESVVATEAFHGVDEDALIEAFAAFAELKSRYALGRAQTVATLATDAARSMGVPRTEIDELRKAALLHDLGMVSIPSGVWQTRATLSHAQKEQIALHPYHTERILRRAPSLSRAATIASLHHERLDGSGYFRAYPGALLDPSARILACADAYCAMREERAYRPAHSANAAADALRAEVGAHRLDAQAADAVLEASGHEQRSVRSAWPSGLTDREVEVLRHAARGLANKEVAQRLGISPRTVQHHIDHIYAKSGVSTRAGLALYSLEHQLLHPPTRSVE